MELFNKQVLALDGARRALGILMFTAVLDALLVAGQACALARVLSALWQAAGSAHGVADELTAQAPGILAFAACYMVRQLIVFLRGRLMEKTAGACAAQLLKELMRVVFRSGRSIVQRNGSGVVTSSAVEGIDRVKSFIALTLPKSVDLMVVPTVLAVVLLALDWISGVIAIIALPCIIFYMRLLGANSKKMAAAQHDEYERLTNHFTDTLRGFPTIKLFGRSAGYERSVYERSEQLRHATVRTLKTVTLSSLVLDLFRVFSLAAIAIMLGFRLMDGSVALFNALAVLVVVPEYFAAIRRYSTDYHATLEGKEQLAAIVAMLEQGGSALFGTEASACREAQAQVPELMPWNTGSSLALVHASYRYEGASRRDAALEDASFEVRGLSKVGIVGASGAGKSTLLDLLAGFSAPAEAGAIVVDGRKLATLGVPSWQRQLTYIPQSPHLFDASVRDNIAFYCPEAPDSAVESAVDAIGLRSMVEELPEGLATRIGKGGRALSGGQAQRIALARALLDGQRRIWLFDEPTAHLDVETELDLKRSMLPLMEGRLVFFATHRVHWMREMDLLVVIEDGAVVQTGTFEELASAEGPFSRLVMELQRGYGR